MRDQQHGLVGLAHDAVDTVADDTQCIDVEAAVGFIKDRERGVDDAHLHHFVALLFTTGKADIDRTLEHIHVHAKRARLLPRNFQEFCAG